MKCLLSPQNIHILRITLRANARTNSTYLVYLSLRRKSTITNWMVNQATTCENSLNKSKAYYCLPPFMFNRDLCLYNRFVLMSHLNLNTRTAGRTCSNFGACSLGTSYQCLSSIFALNYLKITLWNLLDCYTFIT